MQLILTLSCCIAAAYSQSSLLATLAAQPLLSNFTALLQQSPGMLERLSETDSDAGHTGS